MFRCVVTALAIALIPLSAGTGRALAAAAPHGDAATSTPHDGEVAADHRDFNKPPIDPDKEMGILFVFTLVLFGLFLFGARTLVWKPLIEALDQREARVNQAHAEAEAAKNEAAHLLARHDAKMAEVYDQVKEIVAKARKEAEAEKAQIIASAEARARELRNQAIADIRQATDQALGQLDREIDRQAAIAAEHVVGHAIG
jgi:F-type H+-transporting ATPase subunit b